MTRASGGSVSGEALRLRPAAWTGRLARMLRGEGVPCTLAASVAACEALPHLDLGDPVDVYLGLRAVYLEDAEHEEAFARCFWTLWRGRSEGEGPGPGRRGDEGEGRGDRPEHRGEGEPAGERVGDRPRPLLRRLREDAGAGSPGETRPAAWSPMESLSRRSFATLSEREVRDLDRLFDRLALRLATRRSRRYRPARRRGRTDIRRSFRHALQHDGEMLRLARRRRRVERPRVVLLCDVSGSMERYSRFLVRFILAAGRKRDVETFVFGTRLTRLTPWLSARPVGEVLAELGGRIPDWSGGTRIGEALETFVEAYGRTLLGSKSVVVILSDGLDRGEIEPLERAMARIHRRARKVIWLNPLLESPEYAPEARGMKAALPHVDEFAPGHSLEALRALTEMIRL